MSIGTGFAHDHGMSGTVIAAIDRGPSTARVLYHASAFAKLLDADLKVLHVDSDGSIAARERLLAECLRFGPYQQDFSEDQVVVRAGRVSEEIFREARGSNAALVVMGSRGHNAVTKLLVGSTCDAVLRNTATPVLLVPPIDMDIVSIGDRVALTCGPVIAAVDLEENARPQLSTASRLAHLGHQPLLVMTVATSRVTDHIAATRLRARAHGLAPLEPASVIVRRGPVAAEIGRCAMVEGAGLVVMGLSAGPRRRPGAIAAAVLKTKRAFVLAVPSVPAAAAEAPNRHRRLATIAWLLAAIGGLGPWTATAQDRLPDVRAIVQFQRAADAYAFLHRQLELRLELAHRDAGDPLDPVAAAELATAIVARRSPEAQPIFTPRVVSALREMAAQAARTPGCDPGELRTGVWEMQHDVHAPATGSRPLSDCIRSALPALPDELEYRSAGTVLLLVDTHANLVVDVLPALLAGSDLRR